MVAYAFSPIDLIPDLIPVLGYLDELILLPLGVALALKMIPPDVLAECRARADASLGRPRSWAGAMHIILAWLVVTGAGMLLRLASDSPQTSVGSVRRREVEMVGSARRARADPTRDQRDGLRG